MIRGVLIGFLAFSAHSAVGADIGSSKIPGFEFSYLDIEKNCSAKRDGRSTLAIVCKGSDLKPISRSCEGFLGAGLANATLNCGGQLWVLNQRCKIEMRGAEKGDINCQL